MLYESYWVVNRWEIELKILIIKNSLCLEGKVSLKGGIKMKRIFNGLFSSNQKIL
jgi:hypothetical protein